MKGYKGGFRAFKIDIHPSLGARNGEFFPTITPATAAKVQKVYSLAREALGPDYDIIVHGHNELDVSSAIKFAQAVEEIKPLFFEDPLSPEFSESWMAVRRSSRVPILTGESLALIEGFRPFIQNQAVDCLQPDLVHAGGITGTKIVADFAASYRMPISLHNVSGYALNHGLATIRGERLQLSADRVPALVRRSAGGGGQHSGGQERLHAGIVAPGLGILLDQGYLKANLADGEPWWALRLKLTRRVFVAGVAAAAPAAAAKAPAATPSKTRSAPVPRFLIPTVTPVDRNGKLRRSSLARHAFVLQRQRRGRRPGARHHGRVLLVLRQGTAGVLLEATVKTRETSKLWPMSAPPTSRKPWS